MLLLAELVSGSGCQVRVSSGDEKKRTRRHVTTQCAAPRPMYRVLLYLHRDMPMTTFLFHLLEHQPGFVKVRMSVVKP